MSYDAEYHLDCERYFPRAAGPRGRGCNRPERRADTDASFGGVSVGRANDGFGRGGAKGHGARARDTVTRGRSISWRWFMPASSRRRRPTSPKLERNGRTIRQSMAPSSLFSITTEIRGLLWRCCRRLRDYSDADLAPARKVIEARLEPTPAKIDEAIARPERPLVERAAQPEYRPSRGRQFRTRRHRFISCWNDPKFQPFIETDAFVQAGFRRGSSGPALHADCSAAGIGSILAAKRDIGRISAPASS